MKLTLIRALTVAGMLALSASAHAMPCGTAFGGNGLAQISLSCFRLLTVGVESIRDDVLSCALVRNRGTLGANSLKQPLRIAAWGYSASIKVQYESAGAL